MRWGPLRPRRFSPRRVAPDVGGPARHPRGWSIHGRGHRLHRAGPPGACGGWERGAGLQPPAGAHFTRTFVLSKTVPVLGARFQRQARRQDNMLESYLLWHIPFEPIFVHFEFSSGLQYCHWNESDGPGRAGGAGQVCKAPKSLLGAGRGAGGSGGPRPGI